MIYNKLSFKFIAEYCLLVLGMQEKKNENYKNWRKYEKI